MWKDDLDVSNKSYSKDHIDADVVCKNDRHTWRFTGFYGHPEANKWVET